MKRPYGESVTVSMEVQYIGNWGQTIELRNFRLRTHTLPLQAEVTSPMSFGAVRVTGAWGRVSKSAHSDSMR
jgi:hypothetical protein